MSEPDDGFEDEWNEGWNDDGWDDDGDDRWDRFPDIPTFGTI